MTTRGKATAAAALVVLVLAAAVLTWWMATADDRAAKRQQEARNRIGYQLCAQQAEGLPTDQLTDALLACAEKYYR